MTRYLVSLLLLIGSTSYAQDTVYITAHFIYGSKPIDVSEQEWFGGKLGGHVGLEIAPDRVIHFNPSGKVRGFGRKGEVGNFRESTVEEFYCTFGCDSIKQMAVRIPISVGDRARLDSIVIHYLHKAPYPYAFFGMRCTAACYDMLSWAKVFKKRSKARMIVRYFYPRRLRKKLARQAKKHDWEVTYTKGTIDRKWDHD